MDTCNAQPSTSNPNGANAQRPNLEVPNAPSSRRTSLRRTAPRTPSTAYRPELTLVREVPAHESSGQPRSIMPMFLRTLIRIPRWILMGIVRGYQLLISPHFPSTCRYHPTCSAYALEAFREYGAVKGVILTVHRLGRCHPWGGHGYDPPRWFGEDAPGEEVKPGDEPRSQASSEATTGSDPVPPPTRTPATPDRAESSFS